ncbi:YdcF family protein [Paenibacillus sp. MZ04-78.2]|uniref:SanA/YdcF family protein n=1 Tax=Paenibacillus sp. MZ04-78.2 TaxID=2962034 RepID=UPI0020B86C9F|nr:YdcF family protein [Paenibacillus sp. MZ04-78.2]MCP3776185.1 YdcF family protein [Paenibacillus sp. MZ04-78.2]
MTGVDRVKPIEPGLRRTVRKLFRFMLAVGAVALLWVGFIQWRMATLPDEKLPPHDVGIVLGAALWQTTPSPALKERLDRAVELYQAGVIPHIIVSGGYDYVDSLLTEAEGMRNYLVEKGVPSASIYLENEARSTLQNMLFSQKIMQDHGWTSAVIVTHRYHAVRALDMARFLGYESPSVSPMDSSVLTMAWHKSRETLAFTKWQWDKMRSVFGYRPFT